MRTGGMSPPSVSLRSGMASCCVGPTTLRPPTASAASGIRQRLPSASAAASVVATNMSSTDGPRPPTSHTPRATAIGVTRRRISALAFLIHRLHFDNGGAVITAHPERDRGRRIVHKHSPNVRGPGKKVFSGLTRSRIEAQHAVVSHRSGPHVTVLVHDDIIGGAPWSGRKPLLESFGTRVKHADPVTAVFSKPEAVVGVYRSAARPGVGCWGLVERDFPGFRV